MKALQTTIKVTTRLFFQDFHQFPSQRKILVFILFEKSQKSLIFPLAINETFREIFKHYEAILFYETYTQNFQLLPFCCMCASRESFPDDHLENVCP